MTISQTSMMCRLINLSKYIDVNTTFDGLYVLHIVFISYQYASNGSCCQFRVGLSAVFALFNQLVIVLNVVWFMGSGSVARTLPGISN